jgi:hypothetical protein
MSRGSFQRDIKIKYEKGKKRRKERKRGGPRGK